MGVLNEPRRAQLWPVEVAVRDLDAADTDLALVTGCHELRGVVGVGHVHLHVLVAGEADGEAVRDPRCPLHGLKVRDLHGRLGGAVEVDQRQRPAELARDLLAVGQQERLPGAGNLA